MRPHEWMVAVTKRRDAVKVQAGRAAPHRDIAMNESNPPWPIDASGPTKEKHRGQAKGDRHDGFVEVLLVLVLMESQARARLVAIYQARVGSEVGVARVCGGAAREVEEGIR